MLTGYETDLFKRVLRELVPFKELPRAVE